MTDKIKQSIITKILFYVRNLKFNLLSFFLSNNRILIIKSSILLFFLSSLVIAQQTTLPRIPKVKLPSQTTPDPQTDVSTITVSASKDLGSTFEGAKNNLNEIPDLVHWDAWDDHDGGYITMHKITISSLNFSVEPNNVRGDISGTYSLKVGKRIFGGPKSFGSCENRRFQATVRTRISIDSGWNINPVTNVEMNLVDGCDATFFNSGLLRKYLPVGITIELILNNQIRNMAQRKLTEHVDRYVGESLRKEKAKENVEKAWNSLLEPMDLKDEGLEDAWLLFQPEAVSLPSLSAQGNSINFKSTIIARPKIFYKSRPDPTNLPFPNIVRPSPNSNFQVLVDSQLDFKSASRLIEDELVSTQPIPGNSFKISGATVEDGAGNQILIKARTTGSVLGYLYLQGKVCLWSGTVGNCPEEVWAPVLPNCPDDTVLSKPQQGNFEIFTYGLKFTVETDEGLKKVEEAVEKQLNNPCYITKIQKRAHWKLTNKINKIRERIIKRLNGKLKPDSNLFATTSISTIRPLNIFASQSKKEFHFISEIAGKMQIEVR